MKKLLLIIMILIPIVSRAVNTVKEDVDAKRASDVSESLLFIHSLDTPKYEVITKLILQEKFKELEDMSKDFEKKFNKNPLYESQLIKLYDAIDGNNEQLLAKLNTWVKQRPSYLSYGFRGAYKEKLGFLARGSKWIHETPPVKVQKMLAIHKDAITDLNQALKENKKFITAYDRLMSIYTASGNDEEVNRIFKKAVQEVPTTYYLRHNFLMTLLPRWGGSFEQMEAYLNMLNDKDFTQNPRIWSLKAEPMAHRGLEAWEAKKYDDAIGFYTEALKYGDRLEFLKNRGNIYWTVKKFDLALADFKRFARYYKNDEKINEGINHLASVLKSQNQTKEIEKR